jgi:hypothetical protein
MGGPVWLSAIFAAMMLAVAVYCTGRLVAARRWRRPTELDTDGAHVVMGVAMAGMLVSGLRTPLPAGLWEGVFGVGAVWFGAQALRARRGPVTSPWRCLHATPHLVECGAMIYMFLLLPAAVVIKNGAGAMGALAVSPAASRFSFLALLMAVFLLGYVIWLADRLMLRSPAVTPAAPPLAAQLPVAQPLAAQLPVAQPLAAWPLVAQPPVASVLATVLSGTPTSASTSATPSAAAATAPAAATIPDAATIPPAATAPAAATIPAVTTAPAACHAATVAPLYLAPRCALLCKAAMGMTMGYMLILML